jgi:hypothetical protein
MPLTANPLPSTVPPATFAIPYDSAAAFCSAQVLTATGFLNNLNSGLIDLGATGSAALGSVSSAGRYVAAWALNVPAMDLSSVDESYKFFLLGSNDVAFGNGNVELLAARDFAAVTAGRFITPLMGASPQNAPFTQIIPFTNLQQKILYRYLKCQVVIAGTTPSVTVTSWISSLGINL